MKKKEKNTVEVKVPRKRDGFKDHKTTVRKKVLPEAKNSPSAGSGNLPPVGPEALGLSPRGPRVQLPTSAPAPVVEPDGYEPATWRFLLLNLEDGKVTFDDANWATAGDYRSEYVTVRIANNLDARQAVGFAVENEEVLQSILDANHDGEDETLHTLKRELQADADELVTDGNELEAEIDELAKENGALVESALGEELPDGFTATFNTSNGEVQATVTDPYGESAKFEYDAHPESNGDLEGDASEAIDEYKVWLEETFPVALGAKNFSDAGFENPQDLAKELLRGDLEVIVRSIYDTSDIDDDEDGNEVEPVRVEAYLGDEYLGEIESIDATSEIEDLLEGKGIELSVGSLASDNGGALSSTGGGEFQLEDTFEVQLGGDSWPSPFFENNS